MADYYSEIPVPWNEFSSTAQRTIDNAINKAKQDHVVLNNAHILRSIIATDWGGFSFTVSALGLEPDEMRNYIMTYEANDQKAVSSLMWSNARYVSLQTQQTLKMSKEFAKVYKKTTIEASEIFMAVFSEENGIGAWVLAKVNMNNEDFRSGLTRILTNPEYMNQEFNKRFELPPFLKNFATNLNFLAIQNKVSPLFGREDEILQVMEILCHKERPNSVLLIGEPGVGKTAIVEGLARKIEFERRKIPARLKKCQVLNLPMNNMISGTTLRGMFEERIKNVINEIKENPHLILFIDEAHVIMGAGAVLGSSANAADVFKAVMARGEVRIIAATTLGEYKEYIKEDEALDRRFRIVNVRESTMEETRQILYNLRPRLERNYSVKIKNEAIDFAVEMSPRYVRHLRLPDKVIGWLDTASVKAEIAGKEEVGIEDVVSVISNVAQIPADMVTRDISDRFKFIEASLSNRIVGQKHAIEAVAKRLKLNKGPLKENFDRPDGVLLFLGPTGVGKTELAKALAEFLFGDEKRMIRIDMSEYQDGQISSTKLIGMPKGIVDSGKGGVLTSQLRDNPYSVVLLDEMEKAHPNVLNLFLQAFDEGWISDGRGKRVYLSDSIVIMTSNLGSVHFKKLTNPMGFRVEENNYVRIKKEIKKELEKTFSPEFINRIDDVVIFDPLSRDEISEIASKMLEEINKVMGKSHKTLRFNKPVLDALVRVGYSLAYGARFLRRKIEEFIKIPINAKWKEANSFTIILKNDEIIVESSLNEFAASSVNKVNAYT